MCAGRRVPVLGRIPFDPGVGAAQAAGLSLPDHDPDGPAARAMAGIWSALEPRLGRTPARKDVT